MTRSCVAAAAQILIAVLLGVQVLLGKLALEAILEADAHGRIGQRRARRRSSGSSPPARSAASLGTFQTQAQRLLGEQRPARRRSTRRSAVTTAVDLETFESPEFFDDLQRVQTNALIQPLDDVDRA